MADVITIKVFEPDMNNDWLRKDVDQEVTANTNWAGKLTVDWDAVENNEVVNFGQLKTLLSEIEVGPGSGSEIVGAIDEELGSSDWRTSTGGGDIIAVNGDYGPYVVLKTDDVNETANRSYVLASERAKLLTVEENATEGADWDTNVANKPVTITTSQASAIVANTAKVGITTEQADKLESVEVGATNGADWDLNITNKPTTITQEQADAIVANTAKYGITAEQSIKLDKLDSVEEGATAGADWDTNVTNKPTTISSTQAADIEVNNAKVGITAQQASDIEANNAKRSYPSADESKLGGIASGAEVNDPNTTLAGNTFNGVDELVKTDGTGKLPALDGSQLTNLPNTGGGSVSDEAYSPTWDGETAEGASKNALFDKIESLSIASGNNATPQELIGIVGEDNWQVAGGNIKDSHQLFLSGALLDEGVDYSVSGDIITFLAPILPIEGTDKFIYYPNTPSVGTVDDDSISTQKIQDGAVSSDKLANSGVAAGTYNTANVTVNDKGVVTAIEGGQGGGGITVLPIDIISTSNDMIGLDLSFDPTNMGAKKEQKIILIGSSTAEGTAGLDDINDSWGKIVESVFSEYVDTFSYDNIALGGTTTYTILPSGTVTPSDRPNPTTIRSISKAVELGATIILCASPSNDANNGYSADEILGNWKIINEYARNNSIVFFQMGSNPRNLSSDKQEVLYSVEKGLMNQHPDTVIPLFNVLSDASFSLDTKWNSGDNIHYNRSGHLRLADEMIKRVKGYIDKNSFYKIVVERSVSGADNFSLIGDIEYGVFHDIAAVAGTAYDYRCKVIDNLGNESEYSSIFTATLNVSLPSLITGSATDVTATTATISGEVTKIGGEAVTAHGFVYGTSPNPTVADTVINKGALSSKVAMTAGITGLVDGTTYYFRSYAENSAGIAYGSDGELVAGGSVSERTVIMNFSGSDEAVFPSGYYPAYGILQSTGASFVDITDTDGNTTGINFVADGEESGDGTGWGHSTGGDPTQNTGGISTGDNSGIYVDSALRSYWFTSKTLYPNGALARLTGLDDNKLYSLKIMPSRDTTGSRITAVTIGGVTNSQEAVGNSDTPIEFLNLSPVSGVIDMNFICSNSEYAYLNVMEITITG